MNLRGDGEAEVAQSSTLLSAPSADEIVVALDEWLACEWRELSMGGGPWRRAHVETVVAQTRLCELALRRFLLVRPLNTEVCPGVTVTLIQPDDPLVTHVGYALKVPGMVMTLSYHWTA